VHGSLLAGRTNKPLFDWPAEGLTGRHRSQQQQQHPAQLGAGGRALREALEEAHQALAHPTHEGGLQESGAHIAVTDRGRPLSPPPSYLDLKEEGEWEEEEQGDSLEPQITRQVMSADAGTAGAQSSSLGSGLSSSDPIMDLVRRSRPELRGCFEMFNPMSEGEYREVVGRWVAILVHTLRHVATHAHEHGHEMQAAQSSRGQRLRGLSARRQLPTTGGRQMHL
jgi:hypothetical protein